MYNKKGNKGITLVELILSVALLSIILLTSATVLNFGQKSFTSLNNSGNMQTQADNILANISREIRESTTDPDITSDRILTLSGNNVVFTWNGMDTLTYRKSGVTRILSTNVSGLVFSPISNKGISIDITLTSGNQTYRIISKAFRRI